jgi:hypothetical protein
MKKLLLSVVLFLSGSIMANELCLKEAITKHDLAVKSL